MSFEQRVKAGELAETAGKMFIQSIENTWYDTFGYPAGIRPVGYRGRSKWQKWQLQNLQLELDKKITRQQWYYLHYIYCCARDLEE